MSIEQLFDQIGHELGWHDHNMRRGRPYNGQPHTCMGARGATEIRGLTFRDLRDCFARWSDCGRLGKCPLLFLPRSTGSAQLP